jgi:hypothetical protein
MVTAWATAVVPKFPVFHHVTDTEKSTDMFSHPETIEGRKMIRRRFDGAALPTIKSSNKKVIINVRI